MRVFYTLALGLGLAACPPAPAKPSPAPPRDVVVVVDVTRPGEASPSSRLAVALAERKETIVPVSCAIDDARSFADCPERIAASLRTLDARRLTLVGVGLGASVAVVIEDPRVAGVVAIAGTYDFSDDANARNPDAALLFTGVADRAALAARSPIRHAKAGPPIVLLTPGEEEPSIAQGARAYANALDRAGAKYAVHWMVPGRTRETIAEEADVLALAGGPVDAEQPIDGAFGVKQRWSRRPPIDSSPFYRDPSIGLTRKVSGLFEVALDPILGDRRVELAPFPMREYRAIPLAAWLASRSAPAGDTLVVTNIRGEELTLPRAEIMKHQPEIVIGLDDETNLWRIVTSYRLLRESSKDQPKAPLPRMVRPVGPFLFFPSGAPEGLRDATTASFGLTPESFVFVKGDRFPEVPADLRDVLLGANGCLKCHALRGAGPRAHHVRAIDAKAHGGYALALDAYPRDVMRRFLFEQDAVAASFGVEPLRVPKATAKALFDFTK